MAIELRREAHTKESQEMVVADAIKAAEGVTVRLTHAVAMETNAPWSCSVSLFEGQIGFPELLRLQIVEAGRSITSRILGPCR